MAITVKIWGSVIGGFNTQLFLAFTHQNADETAYNAW